ncbi:hypothetical protein, partial [Pseudomonas sp. FSL A6-1183]
CEELPRKTKLKILKHRLVTLTTEGYYEEFYDQAIQAQSLLAEYEDRDLPFSTLIAALSDLLNEDPILATFLGI